MTLTYDMPLWRPPSEGSNLIIQATISCSFNGCTFCSMEPADEFIQKLRIDVLYTQKPLTAFFIVFYCNYMRAARGV